MNPLKVGLIVGGLVGLLLVPVVLSWPAQAGTASLGLELSRTAPAVGPGYVDSFTVACGSSATAIRPAAPYTDAMLSYSCQNVSTTIVGIGDSGIADPDVGTRNSPVYCATNCPAQEFGGNTRAEYCRADTGTVTIYCRALVSASSAP